MVHLLPTAKMPALPPVSPVPTATDPAVAAAAQATVAAQQQAAGRASTILTSPAGVTAAPAGAPKILLGG